MTLLRIGKKKKVYSAEQGYVYYCKLSDNLS